jgi:ribosomal protein L13E
MIQTRQMTRAEIAAQRAARAGRATPAPKRLPTIAENIASHMRDIAAVNDGACRDQDLLLRGFTLGELRHHGVEANHLAIAAAEVYRIGAEL